MEIYQTSYAFYTTSTIPESLSLDQLKLEAQLGSVVLGHDALLLYEMLIEENCSNIRIIPLDIEKMRTRVYSKQTRVQTIPSLQDEEGKLNGSQCQPTSLNITLEGFGEVTFLQNTGFNMIQLSGPKSDLYVGNHKGKITYYSENEVMYEQEFDIKIIAARQSAPYFKGYKPLPGYKFEKEGPIGLPQWQLELGLAEYNLPKIRD